MKGIPNLTHPMALAEKRILAQAELIIASIDRLKYLIDNFQTHKGFGPIKSIRRGHAKSGLEALKPLLEEGEKYREAYLSAIDKADTGDLAKLGYMYIVSLEHYKLPGIMAFSYEPISNRYISEIGLRSWKWMVDGLLVPELKSYGK